MCSHRHKVYSAEAQMMNPPKHFWVCEDCGDTGHEALPAGVEYDEARFLNAMRRFFPDDPYWTSVRPGRS